MVLAVVWSLLALVVPAPAPALAGAPARAPGGRVVERTFTNAAGTRTYYLYAPAKIATGRPLMVWLHGCTAPDPPRAGHALAKVAEEGGFVLVAPVQDRKANRMACWNWMAAGDQHRGAGEPSIIAGITEEVMAEFGTDPSRVYVGGYSAGGAMTTVMGATYPDLYAAIAPSSGAPYASEPSGRKAYDEMGERARPMPAFLLQGAFDEISNYAVGRLNLLQWLGTDDFADDGAQNDSVSRQPSNVEPRPPEPGLPMPLVFEHYRAADGCALGLFLTSPTEHAVNGVLFVTDAGIGLQRLMMDFLLAQRLGAAHRVCD